MLTYMQLLEEFEHLYKNVVKQSSPLDAQAIIVLTSDGVEQDELENSSRVMRGIGAFHQLSENTPFYFNGVTEEESSALQLMHELGVPENVALFQDCGRRGVANTKTQMDVIASDPRTRELTSVVLVTSSYHIPRVARTASKILPITMKFVVLANMQDHRIFNAFLKVAGEIERIIKYVEKGDIAKFPRQQ